MDKAQLEADVRRGERAQQLLEDDLLVSAMAAVRDSAFREFKSASPDNELALKMARLKLDVAEEFLNSLTKHVSDAVMANDKLGRD